VASAEAFEPPIGGGGGAPVIDFGGIAGGGGAAERMEGGGGGGAPEGRLTAGIDIPGGAVSPNSVFCRVIDGGGGTREGAGTLGIPGGAGRDFLLASPSKMSRSELALSLMFDCLLL